MVATLLRPAGAEDCLKRTTKILDEQMDADMWQTRLLKDDNDRMLADLIVWREKNGLVGKDWAERIGGLQVRQWRVLIAPWVARSVVRSRRSVGMVGQNREERAL